jgi:hypothetical protein
MGLRRIPTLAKNARVGQPQQKVGQPPFFPRGEPVGMYDE